MLKLRAIFMLLFFLSLLLIGPIFAEDSQKESDDTALLEEIIQREYVAEKEPAANLNYDDEDERLMLNKEKRRRNEMNREEHAETDEELLVPYWY